MKVLENPWGYLTIINQIQIYFKNFIGTNDFEHEIYKNKDS